MTSNLGSQWITEHGLSWDEIRNRVLEVVRTHFRPELLNRIDDIIVFHALALEQIQRIVEIQLRSLRKRLEDRHVTLDLTPAALEFLAREGFDPIYGARPLKRAIQKEIIQPLAIRLLQGDFGDGDTIVADASDGRIGFRKREATVAVGG